MCNNLVGTHHQSNHFAVSVLRSCCMTNQYFGCLPNSASCMFLSIVRKDNKTYNVIGSGCSFQSQSSHSSNKWVWHTVKARPLWSVFTHPALKYPSSRNHHQAEARYSSRAPMALFLMLPDNPAQPAPAVPHRFFWHRCIVVLYL